MLLLALPLVVTIGLVCAQRVHDLFSRVTTACGVECRAELREMESLYILHRDEGYSCAAEFRACLEMVEP